ncbi:MAG TPA: ECF-type sigma factor [Gemmatimonadaceae bacterium]|jgi:RNA polymerase sigma factor (TIGR02999 family)|nr:ECF-type sigma factor [Gemmatimonadaceae bacterium]
MSNTKRDGVERLLQELKAGNREAFSELLPLVYDELHSIAARHRSQWDGEETLNTTALIHEAYLRLADQSAPEWQSYPHFLAVASTAMRQILLDYAKRKRAAKRGGNFKQVSLHDIEASLENPALVDDARSAALIALDKSLERLHAIDPRQCKVVECRFFGRMTIEDTATALGIAPATVGRDWMTAKTWLYRDLKQTLGEDVP